MSDSIQVPPPLRLTAKPSIDLSLCCGRPLSVSSPNAINACFLAARLALGHLRLTRQNGLCQVPGTALSGRKRLTTSVASPHDER